jgi:hypothetical protein
MMAAADSIQLLLPWRSAKLRAKNGSVEAKAWKWKVDLEIAPRLM